MERVVAETCPDDFFAEGKIKQWDKLSYFLTAMVLAHQLENQLTVIALPAHLVRMHSIQIKNSLTEPEIFSEIHHYIERDFPGIQEELCIDFSVFPLQNKPYADLFFIAARKEYVSQYIDCIRASGLKVVMVEVDFNAARRVISSSDLIKKEYPHALIYLANQTATLLIFDTEKIFFHQNMDVSELRNVVPQLKNQIKICESSYRHLNINQFIICGDREYIEVIHPHKDELLPFQIGDINPFQRMNFYQPLPLREASPFLLACGLAMQKVPKWSALI